MSAGWVLALVLASQAPGEGDRQVKFKVKQALLYLKDKAPAQAKQTLAPLLTEEPGKSDPLVWLAMGRACYEDNDLLGAGRHVVEAEARNLNNALNDAWAKKFYEEFQKGVGRIRIRTDQALCERARFAVSPVNPLNSAQEALVSGIPGWQSGEVSVPSKDILFLPAGRYDLGKTADGAPVTSIEVAAGKETAVTLEEVGAKCVANVGVELVEGGPAPAPSGLPVWVWIVGGVLAAGGAATVTALVATGGGDKQLGFEL